MDELTRAAYQAMVQRDWEGLRLILHPYLHWTTADGTRLRGRTKVLARLQAGTLPAEPTAVELRDGQIYLWQEPPKVPEQPARNGPCLPSESVGAGWLPLVPCARNPAHISAAQAAPRCVLLGRHTTRYPSLVGLAMHPPGRRTYAPDSWRRALVK